MQQMQQSQETPPPELIPEHLSKHGPPCKRCERPSIVGNYGFCGVHRSHVKRVDTKVRSHLDHSNFTPQLQQPVPSAAKSAATAEWEKSMPDKSPHCGEIFTVIVHNTKSAAQFLFNSTPKPKPPPQPRYNSQQSYYHMSPYQRQQQQMQQMQQSQQKKPAPYTPSTGGSLVTVQVPPGINAGQHFIVQTANGQRFMVQVPAGVLSGQHIQVQTPATPAPAPPVAASTNQAAPPADPQQEASRTIHL